MPFMMLLSPLAGSTVKEELKVALGSKFVWPVAFQYTFSAISTF